jgi:Na+:H+ antiporter, NhaA family
MFGGQMTRQTLPASRGFVSGVLLRPVQRFIELEAASSLLLLFCAVVALVWANSRFADAYFHLWETPVGITVGGWSLTETLHHWINDGLMAIFFFVIGLEIKREVLVGELASPRRAALPLAAALGGMIVPAAIYSAFNAGSPALRGWGIPMATDIAFALGVLTLLGSRAPLALKVFLTALAIVDDLGAVLVIALFYTSELSTTALGFALLLLAAMVGLNRGGVRHPLAYLLLGIALWLAVLKSGVHATVAGVLAALTIPAWQRIDAGRFAQHARATLDSFEAGGERGEERLANEQQSAVEELEDACEAVQSPLARLEHSLHDWVVFFIMPVFALANAGVQLTGGIGSALLSPVALGIVLGLFLGKQVGVLAFAWLSVRLRLAALPESVSWRQLYGVSVLCGIGFTMSLFIANLAFLADHETLDVAKTATLTGSLISGVVGFLLLRKS